MKNEIKVEISVGTEFKGIPNYELSKYFREEYIKLSKVLDNYKNSLDYTINEYAKAKAYVEVRKELDIEDWQVRSTPLAEDEPTILEESLNHIKDFEQHIALLETYLKVLNQFSKVVEGGYLK